MKTVLILIFLFAIVPRIADSQINPAVLFKGDYGAILPNDGLEFRDGKYMISGADDPTATATNASTGSIYISSSTGLTYQKQDNGSSTNWTPLYFVPVFADDNRLVRTDGTSDVQQSGITVSDQDEISGITRLDVDDTRIDGFTVSTTATDQSLELSPNGTGTVDITYLDDSGSAIFTGINGALSADFPNYRYSTLDQLLYVPGLQADNVQVTGNTISTSDLDGDLTLDPNGTGEVIVDGFTGGFLLESSVSGGLAESTATAADFDDKLDKFPTETNSDRVVRTDVDGNAVKGSVVEIDDAGAMSGLTSLDVDNLNLDGNTITSTDLDGNVILDANGTGTVDVQAPFKIEAIAANQVPFGDNTDGTLEGSANFLYSSASDLLRAGGLDFTGNLIESVATNTNVTVRGDGTGKVIIDDDAEIANISVIGSAIEGLEATEDITINPATGRRVEIGDLLLENNEIFSEAANPLLITPAGGQVLGVDDLTLDANQVGISSLDTDLELSGNGTGRVKIDRAGTLHEAGNNDNELSEYLADPSFERGVAEWSCTNATVAVDTTRKATDKGKQSALITATADGGFCDLTFDFTTLGADLDSSVEVGAYFATADASANVQILKNNSVWSDAEDSIVIDDKFRYISSFPRAQGITGIRVLVDNTDTVGVDEATISLGKAKVAASKECSSTLDCENKPSGYYDHNEASAPDSIKTQTPSLWITNVTRSGTSDFTKTLTVNTGVFSQTPSCLATAQDSVDVHYDKASSSATSLVFKTRNTDTSSGLDRDFSFSCTKHPDDYKTTQQQGVILTGGNSAGALLSASDSGDTTRKDITTTLSKIDLANVSLEDHLDWDTGNSQGEILISGTYLMMVNLPVFNSTSTGQTYATIEIDQGEGAGFVETSEHPCISYTSSSVSISNDMSCPYLLTLEKGEKIRVSAVSSVSGGKLLQDLTINGKNISPRLTVVPVLTRAEIAADLKGASPDRYCLIEDRKASGTDGGASSTTPVARDLNYTEGQCDFLTLASNQFTLKQGKYLVEWSAPAYASNKHQTCLYSGSACLKTGSMEFSQQAGNNFTRSLGYHVLNVTSESSYAIFHEVQTSQAGNGWGGEGGSSLTITDEEVYTQVKVQRIGD